MVWAQWGIILLSACCAVYLLRAVGGLIGFVLSVPFIICGGHFLSRRLCSWVSGWLGSAIFFPSARLKATPEIMSPVRGLMENHRWDEADLALTELEQQFPLSAAVAVARVEYLQQTGDHHLIPEYVLQFMRRPKRGVDADTTRLWLLATDEAYVAEVEEALRKELRNRNYPSAQQSQLRQRLAALTAEKK